ncbi:MAG: glycosyltransferase family 2 protein, partial [Thermoprotei archaeon]
MNTVGHKISFIIPTIRSKILTLESISNLLRLKYNVEVIVVVDRKGRNPAWARNEGARRAKGDIYIFCDDDVVFSHELIDYVINIVNRNRR